MGDQTHVSTRVMGTYGYAAPEYVMTGTSSFKILLSYLWTNTVLLVLPRSEASCIKITYLYRKLVLL